MWQTARQVSGTSKNSYSRSFNCLGEKMRSLSLLFRSTIRFWWRDTRLSELANTPPPASINFLTVQSTETSAGSNSPPKYHFPYPTSFIPVPYHSNTTLLNLEHEIIPAARMWREIIVSIPVAGTSLLGGMEVEPLDTNSPFSFSSPHPRSPTAVSSPRPQITLTPASVRIEPDGMLLYVSEAGYEPGTSPLSSWVPIKGYDDEEAGIVKEGPLDLFRRWVILFVYMPT